MEGKPTVQDVLRQFYPGYLERYTWYYVKKKYKLNVDFFAESTESDSAVFRNHVFQIIQSG